MKVLVIVNPQAGTSGPEDSGKLQKEWRDIFMSRGVDAEIASVPLEGLRARIKSAAGQGVDAVVAAGGDGTINAVASHLAGTALPLGILPIGTRNHFAKDAGIPRELMASVNVIAGQFTRRFDVGEVNGRIFLNNSSIGAYPEAVKEREREREERRRRKSTAMMVALLRVFRLRPLLHVRITHHDLTCRRRTPFVFVGNNEYGNLMKEEKRPRLDAGTLCLFTAKSTGLLCLLRLVRDGVFNRLAKSPDFEYQLVKEVTLDLRERTLQVSADGEVVSMSGPLRYRTRPGALRVLVPKETPP